MATQEEGRVTLSLLQLSFEALLRSERLPKPETEYLFDPTRRWKFDFAWPVERVAVEIHGGVYKNDKQDSSKRGRHTRGKGFINDREKMNEAQLQGWIVLEICSDTIDARGVAWVKRAIALRRSYSP